MGFLASVLCNMGEARMLIGIPPLLGPELLAILRAMGHGDEIAVVDGNYPAAEHARRLVRVDGHGLLPVIEAILTVLPLDCDAPALFRSALNNDPAQKGDIHHRIDALFAKAAPGAKMTALTGEALYPRIRAAHAIVATSETELFANVILRKGVIGPTD
jgi:L-fucose mutarotase